MKKQLLTILGMFFLVLMVGNVMAQGPKPKQKTSAGSNGQPTPCTASMIDIYFLEEFPPTTVPTFPSQVYVTEEYITWADYNNNQTSVQTVNTAMPNFQYDEENLREGYARKDFKTIAYHQSCGFYFYKITVSSLVEGQMYTYSKVMISGGFPLADLVHTVSASPNPISSNTTLSYSLFTGIEQLDVSILDDGGDVKNQITYTKFSGGQFLTAGQHSIPLSFAGLPAGYYIIRVVASENGESQVETVRVLKTNSGGF